VAISGQSGKQPRRQLTTRAAYAEPRWWPWRPEVFSTVVRRWVRLHPRVAGHHVRSRTAGRRDRYSRSCSRSPIAIPRRGRIAALRPPTGLRVSS